MRCRIAVNRGIRTNASREDEPPRDEPLVVVKVDVAEIEVPAFPAIAEFGAGSEVEFSGVLGR